MIDMNIEMPADDEKNQAVCAILDSAPLLTERERLRRSITHIPISVLFFGVGDSLFLACILGALCLVPVTAAAAQKVPVPSLLFLFSPLLYGLLQGLTAWKELMCGTYEWKQSCRIPLRTLTGLRMLIFGGASTVVCVPVSVILRYVSGGTVGLLWMLALSFSSLFLYASLTLSLQRSTVRWVTLAVAPAIWVGVGIVLIKFKGASRLLMEIPAFVFCLIAALSLGLFLSQIKRCILKPVEGGAYYAVR